MGGACGVSKYVMCGHWCQSANWRNLAAAAGVHASSGSAAQHGTSPEGGGATNHARLSLTSQRLRKGGEARPRLGRHGVLPGRSGGVQRRGRRRGDGSRLGAGQRGRRGGEQQRGRRRGGGGQLGAGRRGRRGGGGRIGAGRQSDGKEEEVAGEEAQHYEQTRAGREATLGRRARGARRPDVGRCHWQRGSSLGRRVAVGRLSDETPEGGSSSAARRAPRAPMTMIDGGRWSSRCRDEPQLCMQMSMRVRCT